MGGGTATTDIKTHNNVNVDVNNRQIWNQNTDYNYNVTEQTSDVNMGEITGGSRNNLVNSVNAKGGTVCFGKTCALMNLENAEEVALQNLMAMRRDQPE